MGFNKSQISDQVMNNIFLQNNNYHNETRKRKIEGLHGIYEIKDRYDGRLTTIKQWMESFKVDGKRLLEMVEENVYGETVVIYRSQYERQVNQFLESITTNMAKVFNDEETKTMTKSVYVPSLVVESQNRKSYADALVKEFSMNPQEGENITPPVPSYQNRMYYGNTKGPASKMLINHNMLKHSMPNM